MKRFEHSLNMRGNAWHARWYRHWLSLGGEEPEYKENLCHYVRVLLIWAPQRWFWHGKIKGVVTPWVMALSAGIVAFAISAFFLWPSKAHEITWKGGVILGVLLVVLGALAFAGELMENSELAAKAKRLTKPVWFIPYKLYIWKEPVWKAIGRGIRGAAKWFFERSYFTEEGPTPFIFALAAAVVVFAILETPIFLAALLGIGVVAASFGGAVILFALIVFILAAVSEFLERKFKDDSSSIGRLASGTTDTIKLGVTYAKTKKQGSRICPFIELEDPVEPSSA